METRKGEKIFKMETIIVNVIKNLGRLDVAYPFFIGSCFSTYKAVVIDEPSFQLVNEKDLSHRIVKQETFKHVLIVDSHVDVPEKRVKLHIIPFDLCPDNDSSSKQKCNLSFKAEIIEDRVIITNASSVILDITNKHLFRNALEGNTGGAKSCSYQDIIIQPSPGNSGNMIIIFQPSSIPGIVFSCHLTAKEFGKIME